MSAQNTAVSELDLHAYVDGRLSDEQRSYVDGFFSANPQERERIRHYQEQNEMFHVMFDSVLAEPVPAEWQRYRRHWRDRLRPVIAASLWIVLGGLLGWVLRGEYGGRSLKQANFARQAAIAHAVYTPEVRHPVEVAAEEEEHLVRWLSKRLGDSLRVPHLSGVGYDLVGGRLLPGDPPGPVAQFMYQDKNGQRLTLYIRNDRNVDQQTAFRFAQEGKIAVFYWIDRRLSYAISGELQRDELLRIARVVYDKINP
jgi:anti-sigma factor RsiW